MQISTTISADRIRSVIADDMRVVDEIIRRSLDSDVVIIKTIAEHIIGSGGKRLRPSMVLLSALACGYAGGNRHHELAAVVEFIHTATLLHDDVVDESELRRGRKTANAEFGNAASVLVGDFLYSRAFQMMVATGDMRILRVLADATNTISEGEVLQLLNAHNTAITEAEYLTVIRRKTAKLFEAAAQLGALIAGVPDAHVEALGQYGMHIGTAFQLIDDVLDYSGDAASTGKNLGDDLNEGKPTLPLIHVLQNGSPEQMQVVRQAIEQGGRAGFADVMAAIQSTGALDYAKAAATQEAEKCRDAIVELKSSKYKDSLLELSFFAVERDH